MTARDLWNALRGTGHTPSEFDAWGNKLTPPVGAQQVFATDDETVADAHPEFVWILLDEPVAPATVPGAPTIGAATAGDGQATAAFTAPADNGGAAITGYTATSSPGGLTATGAASPLTVTGLTNGTVYTFTVVATNSVGNSAPSAASNSVTPEAVSVAPDAPTGLTATGGDAQVSLAWTASAGADGHRVYRHTTNDFALATQVGADLGAAANSYTDTTVTNGTAYWYWIVAFNTAGVSDPSAAATATPAAAGTFNPLTTVSWHTSVWASQMDPARTDGDPVPVWGPFTPVEATQPVYRASVAAYNSKPAVEFDLSPMITADFATDLTQPLTVVVVGNVATGPQFFFAGGDATRRADGWAHGLGTPATWGTNAGVDLLSQHDVPLNSRVIFVATFNGATSTSRINGVTATPGNAGTHILRALRLGGNSVNTADRRMVGHVLFAGLKAGELTAQELTDLESGFAAEYGITLL